MPKVKLDSTVVLTAHCPPGKRKLDLYDTTITGFVLETRPSGGKTYYLRYQDEGGTQRQHKIGSAADISFAQARKEAQRLRSEVVLGGNPAATKQEKKAVPFYADLARQHLAHAKTYQRAYTTTKGIVENHLIPKWGRMKLTDISQQAVTQWLAEKTAGGLAPATVEKIRVTMGKSFELARQWNMAGSDRNPTRGIPRKPINNARDRFLTADEVKRLQAAVAKSANTQLPNIVNLLLLTGARLSELLKAEWRHVSLETRTWLIPHPKNGKPRHVPLSQAAIDLIGQLPRFKDCPYLVPNPETKEPFVTIKHAWMTARDEAKLPGLRLHDLRHACASFLVNSGVDLLTVGRILGHADYKSTMRYSHLAQDTLLAAVEAGAMKMQGIAT